MPFLNDVTPHLTGPLLRFLAIWIELVVFALALPSGFDVLKLAVFGLTFLLMVFDFVLALQRRKARRVCQKLNMTSTFQPKIGIIVVDLLFGLGYTAMFVLFMLGTNYWEVYYTLHFRRFDVFSAFVMVGLLSIA